MGLKGILLAIKWGGLGIGAAAISAAAFYLTTTLLSVGELREQNEAQAAQLGQMQVAVTAHREETQRLSQAVTARSSIDRQIRSEIAGLVAAAEGVVHACDPEPLDPRYVDQLRSAANRSAAAAGVPHGTPGVAGTDAGGESATSDVR